MDKMQESLVENPDSWDTGQYYEGPQGFAQQIQLETVNPKTAAPISPTPEINNYFTVQNPIVSDDLNGHFGISNGPPGLNLLVRLDQLIVKKQVDPIEVFTGWEINNNYSIHNRIDQQIYFAAEVSKCCKRMCCGHCRPFNMVVVDIYGNQVIHINRPLRCSGCCFPCCLQMLTVESPPGYVIGYIEEEWSIFYNKLAIKNAAGDVMLRIKSPVCRCRCCADHNFHILSADSTAKVGKVTRQWEGIIKDVFTAASTFSINFPMDLDVNTKATLLGACILIDYMIFEDKRNRVS